VGNDAIRRHHTETGLLEELAADLSDMASEPWAPHIWYHDPRFAELVPKGDDTVHEIATVGSAVDRRFLWKHARELRDALDAQARLSLLDAIAHYVEAISGQHGKRLDVLLAVTGLNGQDPIIGREAARRLVSAHLPDRQSTAPAYGKGTTGERALASSDRDHRSDTMANRILTARYRDDKECVLALEDRDLVRIWSARR
jgi:hypothetical protein